MSAWLYNGYGPLGAKCRRDRLLPEAAHSRQGSFERLADQDLGGSKMCVRRSKVTCIATSASIGGGGESYGRRQVCTAADPYYHSTSDFRHPVIAP